MGTVSIRTGFLVGNSFINSQIEISIRKGFPDFKILGFAGKITQESKERIKEAIKNSGFKFPNGKIIVNIKPVDIPKADQHFDLAIACGILLITKQIFINETKLNKLIFIGELNFRGEVNAELPVLASYIKFIKSNKSHPILITSKSNFEELAKYIGIVPNILITNLYQCQRIGIPSLDLEKNLNSEISLQRIDSQNPKIKIPSNLLNAILIMASTNLNSFLIGPPGYGKTYLIEIIHLLKNTINLDNFLEQIICHGPNRIDENTIIPLRKPNQFTNKSNFLGRAGKFELGEITLATGGILAMNEFPEFNREILNNLKTVIDQTNISLENKGISQTFRADFQLIAASNPCKCGYLGSQKKDCTCTEYEIRQYFRNISGGLLDRFAIFLSYNPEEEEEYSLHDLNLLLPKNKNCDSKFLFKQNSTHIKKIKKSFNFSHRKINFLIEIAQNLALIYGTNKVEEKHLYEAAYYTDDSKFRTLLGDNK